MKINLAKEIDNIFKNYGNQVFNAVENALDDASEVLEKKLSAASPVGNSDNHFRDNWSRKMQYKGVRYVGNKKMVQRGAYTSKKTGQSTRHAGGIPLSSIMEYSKNGKPFILKTWENNKNDVFEIFKKSLGGKI